MAPKKLMIIMIIIVNQSVKQSKINYFQSHTQPAGKIHQNTAKCKQKFKCTSADFYSKSINQSINLYRVIVQRHVLQCSYAESKRNVLRRILNVLTDGADVATSNNT